MFATTFSSTECGITPASPRPSRPHVPSSDAGPTQLPRPASLPHCAAAAGRRPWLEAWPAAGGGVLLGMVVRSLAGDTPHRAANKTVFLRVDTAGRATVLVPYVALEDEAARCAAALIAGELGAPPECITVDHGLRHRPGRAPVVDLSPEAESGMSRLGAAARSLLITAAAETWGIAATECLVEAGRIHDVAGTRLLAFGAVAQDAALEDLPVALRLSDETAAGRSRARSGSGAAPLRVKPRRTVP